MIGKIGCWVSLRLLLAFAVATSCMAAESEASSITIGTGSQTGVYFPTGSAICRLLNRGFIDHGIRCHVESTEGSVANLIRLRAGELDLAIVQSDWQYHAYHGSGAFAEQGPLSALRAVFSLHSEAFTLIARADSGIRGFADLQGKRVNIGKPGSGQRATLDVLLKEQGWGLSNFTKATELPVEKQAQALCDDEIDAVIYTVGHPNASVLEATTACDSVLVPVTVPAVADLIRTTPYYALAIIPSEMYRGSPEPIVTFGVKATLVASVELDETVVYELVKTVFEHLNEFRRLHPALGQLKPEEMVHDGNTAPLHPGAIRYYREAGLLAE